MYAIIASWDGNNRVTSYNIAADETAAQANVADLIAKGKAGAFYTTQPEGRVEDWLVDPVAKTAIYDPAPVVTSVPQSVTPLQARKAINAAGLRSSIEAAVAASGQDAQDAWEYATVIERNNAIIASMAAGLGLTSAQIDDLFRAAATL